MADTALTEGVVSHASPGARQTALGVLQGLPQYTPCFVQQVAVPTAQYTHRSIPTFTGSLFLAPQAELHAEAGRALSCLVWQQRVAPVRGLVGLELGREEHLLQLEQESR